VTKITLGTLDPRALTSGSGSIVIRDTKHGVVVASKGYPRKSTETEAQRNQRVRFGMASKIAAAATYLDYETARNFAQGTEQVPRDILTDAALGTYFIIVNPDGSEWTHADRMWSPIYEEETDVNWQWSLWDDAWLTSLNTGSYCFKGAIIVPRANGTITGVRSIYTTVALGQYRAIVATLNGSNVIQSLVTGEQQAGVTAQQKLMSWSLTAELVAGNRYAVMVGRTDASATLSLPIHYNSLQKWLWPVTHVGDAFLAQTVPAVGHTITTTSVWTPPLGLGFGS